ncbi:uncharacterized protein LOC124404674 [Diprion similis]|uniref:uncharacterized protein LOC124404674 n=1 Tax=Diprion similis TaxID=362088 RepID=UPI001EF91E3A|nr:uncharacterized protein LOC124404674 [Diprion similis]
MLVFGVLFLAAFYGSTPSEAGDPTLRVNILSVDVVQKKSEFVDEWTATITQAKPANKVGIVAPISKTFPEDMMLSTNITLEGSPVLFIDMSLCEAMEDEVIAKGFLAAGKPFPSECALTEGNYRIVDYTIDTNSLPTIPDGKLEGNIALHMPDEESFLLLTFTGTVSHEVPGIG